MIVKCGIKIKNLKQIFADSANVIFTLGNNVGLDQNVLDKNAV